LAVLGPPFVILLLMLGLEDLAYTPWRFAGLDELYKPQNTSYVKFVDWASLVIPLAVLICCLAIWIGGRRRRRSAQSETNALDLAFPYVALILAVGASVRTAMLSEANAASRIGTLEAWVWVAVCILVLLLQTVLLSFERGVDPPTAGSSVFLRSDA
jgi:hypothetical protein